MNRIRARHLLHGTTRQAFNSRQQGFHSRWQSLAPYPERPARRDDISTVTGDFLSTSENLALQTVIPQYGMPSYYNGQTASSNRLHRRRRRPTALTARPRHSDRLQVCLSTPSSAFPAARTRALPLPRWPSRADGVTPMSSHPTHLISY